jgi:hypothetical protein
MDQGKHRCTNTRFTAPNAARKAESVNGPSKYTQLAALLVASGAHILKLTFADVTKLVPGGLPESAYRYRTWWTSNTGSSAQSRHGWTSAGYRVSQVDLTNHLVIFIRQPRLPQTAPLGSDSPPGQAASPRRQPA